MSKGIRIGIIWVNPYSDNLGVGALAYSALAIINDICIEEHIKAEITLINSSGKYRETINLNNQAIKFYNIPAIDFLKWKSLVKLLVLPNKYKTKRLFGFDVVFDIAEGDSFTDIYGTKRFEKILNSKRFFNFIGTKQVLLPQTIGPFITNKHEKIAFQVMNRIDKVISRDKKSFEYTSRFLPVDKISESIDVAFYLPFKKLVFDSAYTHIGMNISGLLWNGGYTKNNQFQLKSDYKDLIESTIDYFLKMENVRIHLVSHVISESQPVEDDYAIAMQFNQKYPQTILAPRFKTPIEAKNYIGGLDFFTGARMHACIAAFSTGVPVVPMAYSRKFNGLFCETLNYNWLADCVNETNGVILEHLKSAFEKRTELKNYIKEINDTIVSSRLKLLKKQLLKSLSHVGINR